MGTARQVRPHRLPHVVSDRLREALALGRRGHAGTRHRGRVGSRTGPADQLMHGASPSIEKVKAGHNPRHAGRRGHRSVPGPRRCARADVDGRPLAELGPGALSESERYWKGANARPPCERSLPARGSGHREPDRSRRAARLSQDHRREDVSRGESGKRPRSMRVRAPRRPRINSCTGQGVRAVWRTHLLRRHRCRRRTADARARRGYRHPPAARPARRCTRSAARSC